ncbi:hypothetical protein NLX62_06785, partial [Mycobacteriaceae bacterium Msp059]|nr:hypothetical protein [Mycobacteriaceae bacterium Msp059]
DPPLYAHWASQDLPRLRRIIAGKAFKIGRVRWPGCRVKCRAPLHPREQGAQLAPAARSRRQVASVVT